MTAIPAPPRGGMAAATTDPDGKPQHLPANEHTFPTHDGVQIFYRAWLPAQPTRKGLLLLHRGHEHSGRLIQTVERLELTDVAVFAATRGSASSAPRRC